MEKVIVTGATGMLGSALVKNLVKKKINVTAIVRPNSTKLNRLAKSKYIRIVECDVSKYNELVDKMEKGFDCFYHFAWEGVYGEKRDDENVQKNNYLNTLEAIKIASKLECKKFVFAGSQAEYGNTTEKRTCETKCNPFLIYGKYKLKCNEEGRVLSNSLGMEYCSGRILSSYGGHDSDNTLIMFLINKLTTGQECNVSSGAQIWDYIHEDDVAEAFYCIGEKGINNKLYPIGSGDGKPLKEYIELVRKVCSEDGRVNFGKSVGSSNNQLTYLVADISELQADTGFKSKVSFEDGIKLIVKQKKRQNNKLFRLFNQFIKFGIVGVSNTLISLAVYYVLVLLGVNYLIANTAGFIVSVLNAFYWNNKYVFKSKNQSSKSKLIKTFVAYGITFVLSTVLNYLFVDVLNISKFLSPILTLFITIPTNFVFNKLFVYKEKFN